MTNKIIFVLIDGLADVAIEAYGGKTPLEQATTPAMDAISKSGLNGLLDPVEPGFACGSDTAHMSILGYDPRKHYRGRGSFEAMGAGIPMQPGDVAFKCNFATVEEKGDEMIVTRRRVDRNFPSWGTELCEYLNGVSLPSFPDVKVIVKYATEHRCGIVLSGPNLTDKISGTDPLKDNLPLRVSKPLIDSPEAERSSKVLNEVAQVFYEKLSEHPLNLKRKEEGLPMANMVTMRGPGERIKVQPFHELHNLRAFMVAPTCIISGLGMSLQIDIIKAPNATGDYSSDFISKARTAIAAFRKPPKAQPYDFGFVHIKAVDDAGHDLDLEKKTHFIQKSDEMIAYMLEELDALEDESGDTFSIVVTGDHSTPVLYGDHSFEPVPLAISAVSAAKETLLQSQNKCSEPGSPKKRRFTQLKDKVQCFSEHEAVHGHLGRFPGNQVMPIIKHFLSASN